MKPSIRSLCLLTVLNWLDEYSTAKFRTWPASLLHKWEASMCCGLGYFFFDLLSFGGKKPLKMTSEVIQQLTVATRGL